MFDKKKGLQIFILVLLLAWYGLFLVQKIDLTIVDLGRHIKNGEVVLSGDFGILETNFYSYTEPNFPVVNHHWGSGVIFYIIWKIAGFAGLSFFYFALSLVIFYLFFRIAQKESGFAIAVFLSVLVIPLIAQRTEIRPEIFSYFFLALFFWILWHWDKGRLKTKWLFVLPLLEILWVNTHIYFIFGPVLVGLFLIDRVGSLWFKKRPIKASKNIALALGLVVLGALANPFGLKGLIYPFNIFREYGYRIIENQSVWFLENLGIISNPNLGLYKLIFTILVLSFVILLIKNRKRFSFVYFILAIIWSVLGWLAIRNFTIFGFFVLPLIAYNLKKSFGQKLKLKSLDAKTTFGFIAITILVITFFTHYQKLPLAQNEFGFGLKSANNQSAIFFKEQNIKGLIFNNYDIGSYLIFHLYPQEKVFNDNRPEAYSVSFFEDIYISAQNNPQVWQEQDQIYNFNVIYFAYHDATPWAQKFLIERVADDAWAPVFVDDYAIIFLKRNDLNQSIIEKYEISRDRFGIKR